jgi:hypothetical protein
MSNQSGLKSHVGIVYVATKQDRYVEEAFLSADSVKQRYPALPITLFTDRLDHPLCSADRFDSVAAAADVNGSFSDSLEGKVERVSSVSLEGKLKRSLSLRLTPYQYTLALDTETQIVTDELMSLFDLLDDVDVAMVETSIDDSYSRLQYGRPMFNTGVILYRRNQLTWDWLAEWAALSERNFRWISKEPLPRVASLRHVADDKIRRTLLGFDQVAMVEILSPEVNQFDLKFKVLDYSWNHRGSRLPERNLQAPRILHAPRDKSTSHASALEAAIQRTSGTVS